MRKRADFLRIQSSGRRVTTPNFVFVLSPAASPSARARLGITASRKIGTAVVRNRAKRLVRVAFRSTPELWPEGSEVVVIVRRPLGELSAGDVIEEWLGVAPVLARRFRELLPQGR